MQKFVLKNFFKKRNLCALFKQSIRSCTVLFSIFGCRICVCALKRLEFLLRNLQLRFKLLRFWLRNSHLRFKLKKFWLRNLRLRFNPKKFWLRNLRLRFQLKKFWLRNLRLRFELKNFWLRNLRLRFKLEKFWLRNLRLRFTMFFSNAQLCILTNVCFVHGDSLVYMEFESGVKTIIEDQVEDNFQQLRPQVAEDLLNFATSLHAQKKTHDGINVKKNVYRSTTLFISALGHHKICDPSCFDILHSLQQNRQTDEFMKQKLNYAVAVACEIQLRWYMQQKRQCDIIESECNRADTLSKVVGMPSTISYFQISYALQNDNAIRFNLTKKLQVIHSPSHLLKVDLCQMFGNTQLLVPVSQICKSALNKQILSSNPKDKRPAFFHS